jgi:hypothetical protein
MFVLCQCQMHLNDFSNARMAELADALASGASVREDVQVQVLFRAPERPNLKRFGLFFL